MKRITPLQLNLLMKLYVSPEQPAFPTETHCEQCRALIAFDMIGYDEAAKRAYFITDRGQAYVDHILSTPFPEKRYVVVRDDQEGEG